MALQIQNPTQAGKGAVAGVDRFHWSQPRKQAHSKDGSYRHDVEFVKNRPGVRVVLRAERGVTPDGFLKTPFRFQCPPLNDFTRPHVVPWPTFETLSVNERSRPQGAALDVYTLETMFVWAPEPFVIWTGTHEYGRPDRRHGVVGLLGSGLDRLDHVALTGVFEPQLFCEELAHLADENVIFRLFAHDPLQWGPMALINTLAVITGITPTEKAGEVGTVYVQVVFQQFRELAQAQQRRRVSSRQNPTTVRVSTSDDLYSLATSLLGKASDWRRIAAVNGIANVAPDSAPALQKWLKAHHRSSLRIPAVQAAEKRPTADQAPSYVWSSVTGQPVVGGQIGLSG